MPTTSTTRLAAPWSAPQRGSRPCGAGFYTSAFRAPKISARHPERGSFAREGSQPPRLLLQPTILRLCGGRLLLVLRYEGRRAASCAMPICIPYNRNSYPCNSRLSGVKPFSRVCLSLAFPRDRTDRLLASSSPGAPHAAFACGAWVTPRRGAALLDPVSPQSPDLEADSTLHAFALALFDSFTSSSPKLETYNLKHKTPQESRA
jgi:hypothetical protein